MNTIRTFGSTVVSLAFWASLVATAAYAGALPHPVPTLRPATPGEIGSLISRERTAFVRALFPGAVGIPPECKLSLVDASVGEVRTNYRLTCAPMEWPGKD